MKYSKLLTVSDSIDGSELVIILKTEGSREIKTQLKKSIRLMNLSVMQGYNGNDFINNNYSFVISFKGFKIPRFLSRYLLNKIKQSN